ncbi:unnamed protein product [Pylaiella littoralis]
MANTKSAKKRIKINRRNNIQNNSYKSLIKYYEKTHLNLIQEYKNSNKIIKGESIPKNIEEKLLTSFAQVVSRIDRAVKKNVIQKNTAIRKKKSIFKKTFTVF